tara:strand:- start:4072 stop:5802 length:1731 start_codon:yes stop_codon:yes gene_type:complete
MKFLIAILLLSLNTIALTFTEIPTKFSEQIKITSPKNNLITINDQLKISGRADKVTSVLVNGKKVEKNKNGQFEYLEKIEKLGKQSILVEFKGKKESFSIKRDFIKLKNPKTIIMTQKELAFINTELVSNRIKRLSLSNKFLKDEFAFFLDKITLKSSDTKLKIQNQAALKRYKNEIQRIVDSKILSLNQNGNFNSNEEVRLIVFLTGISKALGYEPSDTIYPEIGKFKGKWFYKTLVIALDKKIITTKEIARIQRPLTNALFIKYSSRIPEIKQQILAQLNFNNPQKQARKVAKETPKAINPSKKVTLTIDSVIELLSTTKEVHGQVAPSKSFSVNWTKVTPDSNGNFSFKVPSKQTKVQLNFGNELIVKELSKPKKVTKIKEKKAAKKTPDRLMTKTNERKISLYSDLSNHWIGKIANKLKLEGKLSNTTKFNPNQPITRADLATLIVNINNVKKKNAQVNSFNDLQPSNPNYNNIQTVVSNNLLNGVSSTSFAPNKKVTKLQAIIVASRMLPDLNDYTNVKLPYNDISKYKWANNNLKKAYHYKIISSNEKLNPNKSITKAELVSLLYKTSKI